MIALPIYTSRAIKATALLEETRALLRAWQPGETSASLRARAREEDLLGKATASRTEDIVEKAFSSRLLVAGDEPAASMRRLLLARGAGPWFSAVLLLQAARADVVLSEAITDFLPGMAERGREVVDTDDFVRFLEARESEGRMVKPWSATVRRRVAQHVLHMLSDFGLLSSPRRGLRTLLPYRPPDLAIAWLACDLHFGGPAGTSPPLDDAQLTAHEDWGIYAMPEPAVREALDRLTDLGLWLFQAAGSVVRITWACSSWPDALAALEGMGGAEHHWNGGHDG